jgi:hypothetical protein
LIKAKEAGDIIMCTATPRIGLYGKTGDKPDIVVGNGYYIENILEEAGERYIIVKDSLEYFFF